MTQIPTNYTIQPGCFEQLENGAACPDRVRKRPEPRKARP